MSAFSFRLQTRTAIAAALLLAACQPAKAPAPAAPPAAELPPIVEEAEAPSKIAITATGDTPKRQAGGWERANIMEVFNAPGAPAELTEAAQASIGKIDPGYVCLTPETAAADDFAARVLEGQYIASEWIQEKASISAGKVDFAANLTDPSQGTGRMEITGTLTETSTDLTVKLAGTTPDGQATNSQYKIVSKRMGECTDQHEAIE